MIKLLKKFVTWAETRWPAKLEVALEDYEALKIEVASLDDLRNRVVALESKLVEVSSKADAVALATGLTHAIAEFTR